MHRNKCGILILEKSSLSPSKITGVKLSGQLDRFVWVFHFLDIFLIFVVGAAPYIRDGYGPGRPRAGPGRAGPKISARKSP